MESVRNLKLTLPGDLVDDLDAAVERYGMARSEFFVEAIKNELLRLSQSRVREDIALIEINESILAQGESVNVVADYGKAGAEAPFTECDMCHDLLPSPRPDVKGPVFCQRCLGIAKGADLSGLDL